jgi:hypothetical protein
MATVLVWCDTLKGNIPLCLNLSNKVYNIKTGRLEPAKGFNVLFKARSTVEGWQGKIIL